MCFLTMTFLCLTCVVTNIFACRSTGQGCTDRVPCCKGFVCVTKMEKPGFCRPVTSAPTDEKLPFGTQEKTQNAAVVGTQDSKLNNTSATTLNAAGARKKGHQPSMKGSQRTASRGRDDPCTRYGGMEDPSECEFPIETTQAPAKVHGCGIHFPRTTCARLLELLAQGKLFTEPLNPRPKQAYHLLSGG